MPNSAGAYTTAEIKSFVEEAKKQLEPYINEIATMEVGRQLHPLREQLYKHVNKTITIEVTRQLNQAQNYDTQASLGLATTRELLEELEARSINAPGSDSIVIRFLAASGINGLSGPTLDYRTVDHA